MRFGWLKYAAIMCLFGAQGLLFFYIPSLLPKVYLSPDETAVAVTARQFGTYWSFRLPNKAVKNVEWAHPRSFVSEGKDLVPVGFLGLPLIAGIVWKIFGEIGLLCLTPFLVLSCIYPLWRFMRGLGRTAQIASVATWLSYPSVILYANRGLFPNLVVVCLALWSAFLVWRNHDWRKRALAGLLFGAALAVRPTEIAWAAVWIIAAWQDGKTRKQMTDDFRNISSFIGSALVVPAISALFAWKTYGSPIFIGYWLRDPVVGVDTTITAASTIANPERIWPFGFHPRAVLANAENYLINILGPWSGVGLLALAVWIRQKAARPFMLVAAWTVFILCFVYGNTVYQDHVGHDVVSVGNSYLRYLLPLAPLFAVSVGALAAWCCETLSRGRAKLTVSFLVGCLVILGVWTAFSKDDEGLNSVMPELVRYESTRYDAYKLFGREAMVVSDRSDKIFFPAMNATSPIPDETALETLVKEYPSSVLLFDTTYSPNKISEMQAKGFYLNPIVETKNQMLYELTLTPLETEEDQEFKLLQ